MSESSVSVSDDVSSVSVSDDAMASEASQVASEVRVKPEIDAALDRLDREHSASADVQANRSPPQGGPAAATRSRSPSPYKPLWRLGWLDGEAEASAAVPPANASTGHGPTAHGAAADAHETGDDLSAVIGKSHAESYSCGDIAAATVRARSHSG